MNTSRRILLVALLFGLLILLGCLFPAFIQDNLITPIALVLWLIWRILNSVDQSFYWIVLVLGAFAFFFARFFQWAAAAPATEQPSAAGANSTLERINYWRLSLNAAAHDSRYSTLEHELGLMLAALYASRQPESVQFEIYDRLKERQIPLPEPIHAFLFPPDPSRPRRSFKQMLASVLDLRRVRIGRSRRRTEAEYYEALERALTYMESTLENRHDDRPADSAHH